MPRQKNKIHKYLMLIVFVGFFISFNLISVNYVNAKSTDDVNTKDKESILQSIENWLKEKNLLEENWSAQAVADVFYKKSLSFFLNRLAFETATWLASGDEGQKPMFYTEGWGEYLKNVGDNAAGFFIEELGKNGPIKFNLCEPSLAVRLKINLGLMQYARPKEPECTFSKMKKNWEQALDNPNFLNDFQDMFNPWSNDLGVALSLQTGIMQKVEKSTNEKGKDREEGGGWRPVRSLIEGRIKTPADLVSSKASQPIREEASWEKVRTGDIVADAIDIFINTLAGKLLEEWFKGGLVSDFPDNSYKWGELKNKLASTGGIAAARKRFKKFMEPNFGVRGDYDVLAELITCPDPTKAGPTNCVITDNFRQAVVNNMTVGEAMKQGYLNAGGVFGFTAEGLEPPYNEGYPYRAMIILRKFRILPVGWEIAAQYIKENSSKTNGTKNLGDLVSCFDKNDEYGGYYSQWCEGLVDPTWVLKAPLNYCAREGAGPEIISEQIIGSGDDSRLAVVRNDNYCADEQSCIKENDDGSCQLYGYCAGEKRKWRFNGDSCEPKYNTCQTFRSRSGQTASYLENTLDYGDCSVSNAGCQGYCADYDYNSGEWKCSESFGDKLYLDGDSEECDAAEEGCREFIRTKAGTGANLIAGSNFETDSDNDGIGDGWREYHSDLVWELSDDAAVGAKSQRIVSGTIIGGSNYGGISARIETDRLLVGEPYTISFYAKKGSSPGNFKITFSNQSGSGDNSCLSFTVTPTAEWKRYSKTCVLDVSKPTIYFWGSAPNKEYFIDAVKLERGNGTAYGDYREQGLVYEKLIPDYMEDVCYVEAGSDYRLADDAPAECENFARKCNQDEVGCEQYTSRASGMSVPAKALAEDYCPAECVGYDTYIQKETVFDSLRDAYFIPSRAKTCGSLSAGCDEFTNLDAVKEGGEGREYYVSLKQCVKPDDAAANCSGFYSWEGSDESGYQLRSFQLQARAGVDEPAVTEDDSSECTEDIYNLDPSDPAYNPDCRQFYNSNGEIFYHLMSRSITCSDNCHPYRRTEKNIDPEITSRGDCGDGDLCGDLSADGDSRCWDDAEAVCYSCKAGGVWDTDQFACVYNAIPGEGQTCSRSSVGCREYAGNTGNNTIDILNNDFEGSSQGWSGIGGSIAEISNEALTVGGNSLYVRGGSYSASTTLKNLINENSSYAISFIAKADSANTSLTVKIDDGVNSSVFTGRADLVAGDWGIYRLNLTQIDYKASGNESLVIEGGADFYIDNIKLTRINDNYYLIKNSWDIPDSCFRDIYGEPVGALYNLGCDQYEDRDGNTHNLRGFSQLCQESAVGCEMMIDTQNYSDYNGATFNSGDDSEVIVPPDKHIYAVYDRDKECGAEAKGCRRLGSPYEYENTTLFKDVYLKDDPDNYNNALCYSGEAGCEEWTSDDGSAYFKDPGAQTCEWRQAAGVASDSWGWYKSKVKKCDDNGNGVIDSDSETSVCLSDNDCSGGAACVTDENDYKCPTDSLKTFGYGGVGGQVPQPTEKIGEYWAGLCPASSSGCSEYIDPVSRFAMNILFNADFSQDVDADGVADEWSAATDGEQSVDLKANTLYILSVFGENTATVKVVDGNGDAVSQLYAFDAESNDLSDLTDSLSVSSTDGKMASAMFYTAANIQNYKAFVVAGNAADSGSGNNSEIGLKKAVIDYQIKGELDKESCNGIVNFEDGCVLFNERAQDGGDKAGLIWDADLTYNDGAGVPPSSGASPEQNNSNTLLKVSPDRVCGKWLDCRSIVAVKGDNGKEENICFDIGLCDRVDDNGNCANFVLEDKIDQEAYIPGDFSRYDNTTGYSKVGLKGVAYNNMKGDYPLGEMEQKGGVIDLPNGNFESANSDGYPSGWGWEGNEWDASKFSVIDNPVAAQTEGVDYAPEGRNFVKVGADVKLTSEYADAVSGVDYILTAYINTINMSSGSAKVRVEQFNSVSDIPIRTNDIITKSSGNGWGFELGLFTTVNDVSRIKVTLYSGGGSVGNFYVDDIKIRPALNSRKNWHTPQSCRLYPEDDSLSCDYLDDSGIRRKGWPGYCLEYDSYPGSSNACLLWWPVDKVKGDGVEEGAGYAGKIPVYYSLAGQAERKYEYRHTYFRGRWANDGCNSDTCPSGYECRAFARKKNNGNDTLSILCYPDGENIIVSDGSEDNLPGYSPGEDYDRFSDDAKNGLLAFTHPNDGWYPYDGIQNYTNAVTGDPSDAYITASNTYAIYLCDGLPECTISQELFRTFVYATKIAQTVTPTGQNKYWSGRVYEGSDYKVPVLNLDYNADDAPFGSVSPPDPVNNPYEWDGVPDDPEIPATLGNQRLQVKAEESGEARAGFVYQCVDADTDNCKYIVEFNDDVPLPYKYYSQDTNINGVDLVKRLFAQGYRVWDWDGVGGHYVETEGTWGPPEIICDGDARETSTDDYCAIPPKIQNIRMNGTTDNTPIYGNGFAKLTFNSALDSQQFPMVMYYVDWGDNESTSATGVEMRDRPNEDNPHTLYHLYNYWDMKAKNIVDQTADNKENTVYCGAAGEEAVNYDGVGSGYVCAAGDCCVARPGIVIKDNWGWCSNGSAINDCGNLEYFAGWVVATEK